MFALLLKALHTPLSYESVSDPEPQKGEVVVALRSAALNHRDVYIRQGLYAGIRCPVILGSDGAGEYRGRPVIINPGMQWGDNAAFQSKDFHILGMPGNGTFAEMVTVPKAQIHPKPDHLTWEQAAALPLAGVTAWRVLFRRCACTPGQRVLISGIGGGAALMAMQFAIATRASVWVTSGSDEKIERATALGAKGGVNYRQSEWDKRLRQEAGGFDIIIDAAGGEGFPALVGLCNPGGRIGIFGGTAGKISQLSPQVIFWKQISIHGSTMGSPSDFKEMLRLVVRQEIVPVVDSVFSLTEGNAAFERMEKGEQFGKIVLNTR